MKSFVVHNVLDLPAESGLKGRPSGVTRRTLSAAPDGSDVTWLFEFPPGYQSNWGRGHENDLETHDSTEEIVVLDGALQFGHWYELGPLHYSSHPDGFPHPANQGSDSGCLVLIRRDSAQINFSFISAPPSWGPVTNMQDLGATQTGAINVGLREVLEKKTPGNDRELTTHQLSRSLAKGMQLTLVSVPPGWAKVDGALGARGSETFLLEGNLSLSSTQLGSIALERYGYFFGSADAHDQLVRSEDGALALRWTTEIENDRAPAQQK